MKSLKLWRTFKEGIQNFRRNGWLTFATVSILTLSLFIISLSFLLGVMTKLVLENMREKVPVMVSFNPDVPEGRILTIKSELSKYTREIESIEYVSRDQALAIFKEMNKEKPTVLQAIDEIGANPMFASLVIKAVEPEYYPVIVSEISNSTFKSDISGINYDTNKVIFERLDRINRTTEKVGLILGGIFAFIAVLITFNTIRITIYSHRQEFEIMRLVGASNIYVRMPFVFEGAFYGLVAVIMTSLFLFGISYSISPLTQGAIPQGNFLNLYLSHFWLIFGSVMLLGIMLGVLSSAIAIRRYLKA